MKRKPLKMIVLVILLAHLMSACYSGSGGGQVPTRCERSTGTAYIGLGRQGSSTGIYNNVDSPASDPLVGCATEHAVITKVSNESGSDIGLAHGGPGSQFIILHSGDTTDLFNGELVEGNWLAQRGGTVVDEPLTISIKVEWKTP